jgi:hypothetical protein
MANSIADNSDKKTVLLVLDKSEDDDLDLWFICSHCGGDGCACCDYDGVVYDPEPNGVN